jgi:hypothetical protein
MPIEVLPYQPVHHVFVDCENVKKDEIAWIENRKIRLHLFLGSLQKSLNVELVEKLLVHASAVEMIRVGKSGKNALDFVLAYHLGREVLADPKGYFHIVAKDSGYDALVELLNSRNVKVKRHEGWEALARHLEPKRSGQAGPTNGKKEAPLAPSPVPTLSTNAAKLLDGLRKSGKSRPKKEKTLVTYAQSLIGKDQSVDLVKNAMEELQNAGHIEIGDKGTVGYQPELFG